jgi:sec-independent protein translocase protein TatA
MGFSLTHLLILVFILVLLFGSTKLPQLGSGLGQGIRNFKKAMKEPDAIDVTPKKSEAEESKDKDKKPSA